MYPAHAVPPSGRPRPPSIAAALVLALTCATGVMLGMATGRRPVPTADQPNAPPATATPLSPSATQILLPALGPLTADPACRTSIHVQLAGDQTSRVVLVTWGDPGACPLEGSPGPSGVECSGILRPGTAWVFSAGQLPAAAESGALFSFNTDVDCFFPLSIAMGRIESLDCDDTIAGIMCEELFFGVVRDAKDYQLFKQRFDTGGLFRGIPQDLAAGSPLVANVVRTCPGPGGSVGALRAAYAGVSGTAFGAVDPSDGTYTYGLAHVIAAAGRSSQVYVQNAGSACAGVEIRFSPEGEAPDPTCGTGPIACTPLTLVPGESVRVDVAQACGATGTSGTLSLTSSAPLAIVVDSPAGGRADYSTSSLAGSTLAAPLLVDTAGGWRARVHLQNTDRRMAASVRATVWDAQAEPVLTHTVRLCPEGGATWDIDLSAGSARPFVGSLHVISQAVTTVDGPMIPRLDGVVELSRVGSGEGLSDLAAAEYPLAPVPQSAPPGADPVGEYVGAVLLPSLVRAPPAGGSSSALVVANAVDAPGTTDLVVMLLDANGVLDHVCQTLGAHQARYFDLGGWPGLPAGFAGSGVVSATAWNHPVAGGAGGIRNAVGLAAVVIEPRPNPPSGGTGDATAVEGIGVAPGQVTGFPGGSHPQGWQTFVPGCPGAPRLASPTPEPTSTPRPTATARPTPDLKVRGFLPLAVTRRVRRR